MELIHFCMTGFTTVVRKTICSSILSVKRVDSKKEFDRFQLTLTTAVKTHENYV